MARLPKLPKERYFILFSYLSEYEAQPTIYEYQIIDQLLCDDRIPIRDEFRLKIREAIVETKELYSTDDDFIQQLAEFKAKCVALNRAYEDDKLYLKQIEKL